MYHETRRIIRDEIRTAIQLISAARKQGGFQVPERRELI